MFDILKPQTAIEIPFSEPTVEPDNTFAPVSAPAPGIPVSTGAEVNGAPEPAPTPDIYAYVKEVVPSNTQGENSSELEFDVILSVSGGLGSATLIKKIKFCKFQLAQELMDNRNHKPATMVEEVIKDDKRESFEQFKIRIRTLCKY
jgi:hypothetical protein